MALIVKKFGGTSVGDLEKIQKVAQKALDAQKEGHQVVVVLSAMAGETNRLVAMAKVFQENPGGRDYDLLVSTGEQVTISLLAMAIEQLGGKGMGFLGHQVKILTDEAHAKARIKHIEGKKIHQALESGHIVVVAGFQGVSEAGEVTTLGRGGSDTSAVALAAALQADLCEIYTDVDGVYTTDPRVVPQAQRIERISFEEMLEMSSMGAKVLQIRSVEMAAKFGVPLVVRSSFEEGPGTWVVREEAAMESQKVTGISFDKNEAKLSLRGLPDIPGIASKVFLPVSEAGINVDMIIQNLSASGKTDLTFTVPKTDLKLAKETLKKLTKELGIAAVEASEDVAKVSVIGLGMRSHAGIAATMFETLAKENINVQMISTSEIKISIVIEEKYLELAVRALHQAFGLEG